MKPIDFKGSNVTYTKPEGVEDDKCGDLPVFRTHNQDFNTLEVTSCWELSDEELEIILRDKKVYLTVMGYQPPVLLSVVPGEALIKQIDYLTSREN